jgi:hypothetical protein
MLLNDFGPCVIFLAALTTSDYPVILTGEIY